MKRVWKSVEMSWTTVTHELCNALRNLRKRSEALQGMAKLTVVAGGILGAGVGTGTGAAASTIVALAELPVGPIAVGAGIGIGMVGEFLVSRMRKSEHEEIRKKLQECGNTELQTETLEKD